MRGAVIVRHREVDRLDAVLVLFLVHRAVRAADRMARLPPETRLERIDERLEEIEEQRVGAAHDLPQILVDQGGEHDRLAIGASRLRLDARQAFLGSLRAVDERQGDLVEIDAFELRQQAVSEHLLHSLAPKDVTALAACGAEIRSWILKAPFPANVEREIKSYYQDLEKIASGEVSFAVRSSATAEDLPEASFAGQQETFLNIRGVDNILEAIRRVYASLYNERAISYRTHHGFDHRGVALSAAVQQMVRSDLGASGVMFTLDTESGFRDVVFITAAYGLGEMIVQGAVNPDEFYVHKPMLEQGRPAIVRRALGSKLEKMLFAGSAEAGRSTRVVEVGAEERARFSLTDPEVLELARYALAIERHYRRPMDIEWAKDGADGKLYILQARPETVKSRKRDVEERYALKGRSRVLASGRAIGHKIGSGAVRVVPDASQMAKVKQGDVLVTDMTDPNWEPVMKLAAAIVTNRGGRTCHAAIIARELGIPAVVGCGDATT